MYRYRSRELSITNPSMEITAALLPTIYSSVLPNPQVPCRSLHIHAHQSTRSLRTFVKHKPRFQRPSIFIDFRTPFHKSLTTTCSLPDEAATSAAEVAMDEFSLTVKKKAADISSDLKGTSIFLVGMKSSMKTSLGKLLAEALRYYYFDSDSLVEEAAGGASTAKSFRETDEKGFREYERHCLGKSDLLSVIKAYLRSTKASALRTEVLKQLSSMGRLVVCAGDSAVKSSTNLALLRHGISLWLDVPLDMVAREMNENSFQLTASEIVSGDHLEVLTRLVARYEEMKGGYATADAKISLQKVASNLGYDELDSVTTEDMTLEVLKELEKLTRVKKMMEEAARPF